MKHNCINIRLIQPHLIHCSLETPYTWVVIDSGNELVLYQANTWSVDLSCGIHLWAISHVLLNLIRDTYMLSDYLLKITIFPSD